MKDHWQLHRLRLEKDGKLVAKYWDYKTRSYPEKEIDTIPSAHMLHDTSCDIGEDVTLRDIFLYINKNLDFWTLIVGNWCDEIVTEGLKPRPEDHNDDDNWSVTEELQLYWSAEINEYKGDKEFSGLSRLDFGAHGHYTRDCEYGHYKKGDPVNIAVDFSPANTIAHLPIVFEKNVTVWDWSGEGPPKELNSWGELDAGLFQIIYGIIWELSFMGGPEDRDDKASEMLKSVEEIKNGTAETVPWEDFKKELEEMDDDEE